MAIIQGDSRVQPDCHVEQVDVHCSLPLHLHADPEGDDGQPESLPKESDRAKDSMAAKVNQKRYDELHLQISEAVQSIEAHG